MSLEFVDFSKNYRDARVFSHFNCKIETGKTACILGASGVGKTTLLNAVASVTEYDGKIIFDGENAKTALSKTGVSFCFQTDRLLDNLSVFQNLEIVMKSRVADKNTRAERIFQLLSIAEIGDYANKYPSELSGGMQRRVAFCRAFCYPSKLILLDEAFRGLDIALKSRQIAAFNRLLLQEKERRTVICVTHEVDTALLIADTVIVLSGKPAKVAFRAEIAFDKSKRELSSPELNEIRGQIYKSIE